MLLVEGAAPPHDPDEQSTSAIPRPPHSFVGGLPKWEQRGPWPVRFFGTATDVILRPNAFFTHLSREGARGTTAFAYLCLLAGLTAMPALCLVFFAYTRDELAVEAMRNTAEAKELTRQMLAIESLAWMWMLAAPVTSFFIVHLLAGAVHVCARVFSPNVTDAPPFEVTYRFVVYAQAPMLLGLVPIVGWTAPLVAVVVLSVAMARLHKLRFLGIVGGVLVPAYIVWSSWSVAVQAFIPVVIPLEAILIEMGSLDATATPPLAKPEDTAANR
jgi:hypothetical protein